MNLRRPRTEQQRRADDDPQTHSSNNHFRMQTEKVDRTHRQALVILKPSTPSENATAAPAANASAEEESLTMSDPLANMTDMTRWNGAFAYASNETSSILNETLVSSYTSTVSPNVTNFGASSAANSTVATAGQSYSTPSAASAYSPRGDYYSPGASAKSPTAAQAVGGMGARPQGGNLYGGGYSGGNGGVGRYAGYPGQAGAAKPRTPRGYSSSAGRPGAFYGGNNGNPVGSRPYYGNNKNNGIGRTIDQGGYYASNTYGAGAGGGGYYYGGMSNGAAGGMNAGGGSMSLPTVPSPNAGQRPKPGGGSGNGGGTSSYGQSSTSGPRGSSSKVQGDTGGEDRSHSNGPMNKKIPLPPSATPPPSAAPVVTASKCKGNSFGGKLSCIAIDHPLSFFGFFALLAVYCYCRGRCWCCRRGHDPRGEYRQVAEQYADVAFADTFGDDYSAGANDDYLSDEDEAWRTNGNHVIEMKNLENDKGLALEEMNG